MAIEHVLLTNLAVIATVLVFLWCLSWLLRNASIVDIFWGCGFVLIAWVSLWASGRLSSKPLFLTLLVSVWGLRLAGYQACRNIGTPEDYRYAAMRERHGKRFPVVGLFTVFALQCVLMWIVALPPIIVITTGRPTSPMTYTPQSNRDSLGATYCGL